MCKSILTLSWEVDKLHNQYEELKKYEELNGLNHSMSNAALSQMRKGQNKLNKILGVYINDKGIIPAFDVRI